MTIQWFPGHMTKAKRQMQEALKTVDMVIEIRDSRIPLASKNPMLDDIINNKPRLILLSKKDKSDPEETEKWIKKLSNEETQVIAIDLLKDPVERILIASSKVCCKKWIDRQLRKGIRPRALRAMVVGVPNVGKSTCINRFSKKRVTNVENRPGITRQLQWIKLSDDLELLDTPGILWPKFDDPQVGLLLSLTGAIKDDVVNLDEIAHFAYKLLSTNHLKQLDDYLLTEEKDCEVFLEQLAIRQGFYLKDAVIDRKRVVEYFIKEVRDNKFGCITWQLADD